MRLLQSAQVVLGQPASVWDRGLLSTVLRTAEKWRVEVLAAMDLVQRESLAPTAVQAWAQAFALLMPLLVWEELQWLGLQVAVVLLW
mmetsp:Transcript_18509/g.43328  ORF Transcript_18509/g.43328 Transcript_18509/m.43328 type:complete len:87 (-) Transcript_18509:58-318(-)